MRASDVLVHLRIRALVSTLIIFYIVRSIKICLTGPNCVLRFCFQYRVVLKLPSAVRRNEMMLNRWNEFLPINRHPVRCLERTEPRACVRASPSGGSTSDLQHQNLYRFRAVITFNENASVQAQQLSHVETIANRSTKPVSIFLYSNVFGSDCK